MNLSNLQIPGGNRIFEDLVLLILLFQQPNKISKISTDFQEKDIYLMFLASLSVFYFNHVLTFDFFVHFQ